MINAVYDLTGCTRAGLEPVDLLHAMRAAVARLGCTILGELPVLFQPHGTTCVLVLAESHLTVATWPEHQLAHVDLFTCRADTDSEHALAPIIDALGATRVHGQRIQRLDPTSSPRLSERDTQHSSNRSAALHEPHSALTGKYRPSSVRTSRRGCWTQASERGDQVVVLALG